MKHDKDKDDYKFPHCQVLLGGIGKLPADFDFDFDYYRKTDLTSVTKIQQPLFQKRNT